MAGNQANAIRCGFMGFPIWGGDTGGYLGEGWIDEQLYIRWLQLSAWNGMFEVKIDGASGRGKDRPPWKYSDELQNVYRNVSNIRMQLLPYIYSCANTSDHNGVMMKPLAYMYPNDENTYDIWDEYIFGNAFLVAPVFTKQNSREIYLPEGEWFDFNDPEKLYIGPETIKLEIPLQKIPVFIKENSIYVTGDIFRGNSKKWQKELAGNEKVKIHLYPGQTGTNTDFCYVDYLANDSIKKMTLSSQKDIISFTSDALNIECGIEAKCMTKPKKVLLNDDEIIFNYDSKNKIVNVKIDKNTSVNLEIVL
jgi:alpha-glucosidase (family GH31 glycosyl hydrolase)